MAGAFCTDGTLIRLSMLSGDSSQRWRGPKPAIAQAADSAPFLARRATTERRRQLAPEAAASRRPPAVSGALFLCIGLLYERHHTRIIKYFAGLLTTMPLFSTFFMLFTMANIGLPGTSSFIGEFLIISGCFLTNT